MINWFGAPYLQLVTFAPPNVTEVSGANAHGVPGAPAGGKFVPFTVTWVPPVGGPCRTERLVTVGPVV